MPMLREDDTPRTGSRDADSPYPDSAPITIRTPTGDAKARWLSRRLSEESIRTELCEGPIPDSPPRPATPPGAVSQAVSDRAELIERLKRGESPTWIPNCHLESLLLQDEQSSPPRTPQAAGAPASPSLLPAPTITPERHDATTRDQQRAGSPAREGATIERPRSALHSGNFTPVEPSPATGDAESAFSRGSESRSLSAHAGWMATSPPRDHTPFYFAHALPSYRREAFASGPSSLSSSLSSSFAYQPPTSPLVQSESNEDLDLTLPLDSFKIDANSPRNSRRHTLNLGASPFGDPAIHRQAPLRRESTHPYQAHQPRRSLHLSPSISIAGLPTPQTPADFRSRRPSLGSEASPLHHASMVGSYEESILRGRMSTTPSKPLEFTAQIGVLGLGKCKPSLRCPAHVSLPFSAVFYNYPSTHSVGSKPEDGPSPYVGQIDLENGLPNPEEEQRAKRKMQSRYQDPKGAAEEPPLSHDGSAELSEGEGGSRAARSKRPSRTPRTPPGGSYRIPEKGQLQIIIKNQNKTAVKLFLVPYDLAGMEPGTKTFIRQRSYSAGPILEGEGPKDGPDLGPERPILRYLIHLHICCPSKGRFYLYKSIRVVFANRVPDGKEKLRNEVTYPDPRFTPYKPTRVMHPPVGTGHAAGGPPLGGISPGAAALAAERAFRRRSAGFSPGQGHHHHPLPQNQYHPQHHSGHHCSYASFKDPAAFVTPAHQALGASAWKAQQALPAEQGLMTAATATTTLAATTPIARAPTIPGQEMVDPFTDNTNTNTIAATGSYIPGESHEEPSGAGSADDNGSANANANANATQSVALITTTPAAAAAAAAAPTEGLLSRRLRSLGVHHQQLQQRAGQEKEQEREHPLHQSRPQSRT
ncbi:hypothetical protein VTG60DRAFT_731 [Thermothelomyces hinnuleus]